MRQSQYRKTQHDNNFKIKHQQLSKHKLPTENALSQSKRSNSQSYMKMNKKLSGEKPNINPIVLKKCKDNGRICDNNQEEYNFSLVKNSKNKTVNDFRKIASLDKIINNKNIYGASHDKLKRLRSQDHRQNCYGYQQQQQQKQTIKSKQRQALLQKIPDHRRIRSSSKISTKIIQLNTFFKQDKPTLPHHKQKQRIKSEITNSQLSEHALQNMLQLKLKTEQSLQTNDRRSTDLISFRNTPQLDLAHSDRHMNTIFNTGHHALNNNSFDNHLQSYQEITPQKRTKYGINMPTPTKLSDILSKNQLNNSKQIIKQNQTIRSNHNLRPNPKQWQFHNCLKLQKIQLYSSNLKISCQAWTALDLLQIKYLRGWNPKIVDDFSPMIRLFVMRVCFDLEKNDVFPYDISTIHVRVNDKHIYEDQREKSKEKGQKLKGIAPHTIISLKDLVSAMILTKHEDLVTHAVLALGFILKILDNHDALNCQDPLLPYKRQKIYQIFIKTTQSSQLQSYCDYFQKQCKQICDQLQLAQTTISLNFNCTFKDFNRKLIKTIQTKSYKKHHQYTILSTSLDISILFMKCLNQNKFKAILSRKVLHAETRFQVGWNFWENRVLHWTNEQLVKYSLQAVGGRNQQGNQCFVVWDQKRDIIVTMADCKVNMHSRDAERVSQWVQKHIARFSKKYCLGISFYPTDTEKFYHIN